MLLVGERIKNETFKIYINFIMGTRINSTLEISCITLQITLHASEP